MIREPPARALLLWFRGGLGMVPGPGTRPDLRFGWDAALRARQAGHMPRASSERAILPIAARPGDPDIPVRLRTVPGNLDTPNITLVADAITAANG